MDWPDAPKTQQWNNLDKELRTRKIMTTTSSDILRWGYQTKGMFTSNEAYIIHSQINNYNMRSIWRKIWSMNHWPKFEYFLWILSHHRVLTWDNL